MNAELNWQLLSHDDDGVCVSPTGAPEILSHNRMLDHAFGRTKVNDLGSLVQLVLDLRRDGVVPLWEQFGELHG